MLFDYINGGEVFFHLQQKERFNENIVRLSAAQIYLILNYLHSVGILYRDMKPENILIDKNGYLKLIDFGLIAYNTENKSKTICGTSEYLPPEVILGNEYGTNFDWWGFGIILYEMLIGCPPFVDDTNKMNLFKKIVSGKPSFRFLGQKIKISKDAKSLIKLLLKKDLKERIKVDDIPNHPFFEGMNFRDVLDRKVVPEFVPEVKGPDDVTNVDEMFLEEDCFSPVKKHKQKEEIKNEGIEMENLFDDF